MNMCSVQLSPCPVGPERHQEPSDSYSTKGAGKARNVGPECVTATISGQDSLEEAEWLQRALSSLEFREQSRGRFFPNNFTG